MMKKLLAILLALAMLLTVTALAEEGGVEEVDEDSNTTITLDEVLNFDITMDKIPEGYTMTKREALGAIYATFTCEGKPDIVVSVAHSEEFDGYTLNLDNLTEEDKASMASGLSEGYSNPTVTYTKTTHGTDLIVVNENGVETDYVSIVGLYDGYIFSAELFNEDGDVSEDDINTAVQIISDMWFVKNN